MQRKSILFAFSLTVILGAALWGVNYRLDHPPLTKADKEFRALVAGADSVQIFKTLVDVASPNEDSYKQTTLNAAQTREIIENIRVDDTSAVAFNSGKSTNEFFVVTFRHQNRDIAFCQWEQSAQRILMQCGNLPNPRYPHHLYQLHPRFNKRLHRTLDAYLPQHVRP